MQVLWSSRDNGNAAAEEPQKQILPDRTQTWLSRAGETDTTITANSPHNEWTRTRESAGGKVGEMQGADMNQLY